MLLLQCNRQLPLGNVLLQLEKSKQKPQYILDNIYLYRLALYSEYYSKTLNSEPEPMICKQLSQCLLQLIPISYSFYYLILLLQSPHPGLYYITTIHRDSNFVVNEFTLKTPAISATVGLATCSNGSIPHSSNECGKCTKILCSSVVNKPGD